MIKACLFTTLLLAPAASWAQPAPPPPGLYDPALAKSVGADERGMRKYILVVLKTGPNKMPAGPERDEMFKGHFANIGRLAKAGKLVVAGPFLDAGEAWRGLYIFATDLEEAKKMVADDPVVKSGEMVPEYHAWYGSAAMMQVTATHERITKPQ